MRTIKEFNIRIRFSYCFLLFTFWAFFLVVLFATLMNFVSAEAGVQVPRPLAHEPRIKVMNYDPNAVHVYTGYYGYQSSIVFEPNETIDFIAMGHSDGWQLVPKQNRLFLKPISENANTNVTIITNFRTYHFEFKAERAQGMDDPELAYEVRITYQDVNTSYSGRKNYAEVNIPDIVDAADSLNFSYTVSGNEALYPLMVFDDGEFTYLRFPSINADWPAVFYVDPDGNESLVNFKYSGDYLILEVVHSVFTLRLGDQAACIFNEKIPMKVTKKPKRPKGLLNRKKQY